MSRMQFRLRFESERSAKEMRLQQVSVEADLALRWLILRANERMSSILIQTFETCLAFFSPLTITMTLNRIKSCEHIYICFDC